MSSPSRATDPGGHRKRTRIDVRTHPASTEPIERGWVCSDGRDHYWTEVVVGDRTVDERCDRCGLHMSEVT